MTITGYTKSGVDSLLTGKAPLASPALTGTPTVNGQQVEDRTHAASTFTKVNEAPLSPFRYGATFDGTTDDTAALQSWLDALTAAGTAADGRMPAGTAKITAPLLVRPLSTYTAMMVRGSGRPNRNLTGDFTYIRQDGGNLPVLEFTKQLSGATFSDFGVGYTNPSGTGNNGQHGFQFDQPSVGAGTTPSWFNCTFERLTVLNAYSMWNLVVAGGQTAQVWDTHWLDIWGDNIQQSGWILKGGAGAPICTWRNIYINNANGSVVATGPIWDMVAVEAHMSGLDLEGWNNTLLSCGGGYNTSVDGVHVEHHTFDAVTTSAYMLFNVAGGHLRVRNGSFAGSSGGGAYGITTLGQCQNASDTFELDAATVAFNPVTGSLYPWYSNSGAFRRGDINISSGTAFSSYAAADRKTIRLDSTLGIVKSGTQATASRPAAAAAGLGAMFYDETLGKPIWSTGSVWKDASGATV